MGKEKLFLNYHRIGALHKGENIHTLVLQTSKTYNELYGAKGDNTKYTLICFFSLDLGQEMETEVVWPRLKVFCLNKNNSTGNSERKKKKR